MKAISDLVDHRINSRNILLEIPLGDYIELVGEVLHKNEFQRRRVRSSKTVYALLKKDLVKGCIIPPVVLALASEKQVEEISLAEVPGFILENKRELVILDGLQRTHTMIDLLADLRASGDIDAIARVRAQKIRVEIYIGINRIGILYRMLTLNTGQTPMSLRQQIEILYLDYADGSLGGVELVREAEGRNVARLNQYNFKDIIEGFNSYLNRDELPFDRSDLLENIESLEKLSNENQSYDIFSGFVKSWHKVASRIISISGDAELDDEFSENHGTPFGKNTISLIKRPQAMSGFGAAIGKLRDFRLIDSFEDIQRSAESICVHDEREFLEQMNRSLLWIKSNTTKIGNAQRSFFQFFFRSLFNPEDESHLNIDLASQAALRKYQTQML